MKCKNCGFNIYPLNPFPLVKWEHVAVNKMCSKAEPLLSSASGDRKEGE